MCVPFRLWRLNLCFTQRYFLYRSFWKSFFTEITRLFLKSGNAKLKMCEVNDRKGQESILTLFQQFWPRKNGSNRMVHFTCVQFELLMNFCGWRMNLHMAFVKPQCELIWWKMFNTHTHCWVVLVVPWQKTLSCRASLFKNLISAKLKKKQFFLGRWDVKPSLKKWKKRM